MEIQQWPWRLRRASKPDIKQAPPPSTTKNHRFSRLLILSGCITMVMINGTSRHKEESLLLALLLRTQLSPTELVSALRCLWSPFPQAPKI